MPDQQRSSITRVPTSIKMLIGAMVLMLAVGPSILDQTVLAPSAADGRDGGILIWGTHNPPTAINPVLTSHSVSSALLGLIFDPLVRVSSTGHVVPGLASRWEVSPDGLLYTFHLRPHVRFHDGRELTAEDVKFTFDAIKDPVNDSHWRGSMDMVAATRVIDRYTFQLALRQPIRGTMNFLAREILPRHLSPGLDQRENPYNYHPIGTGAFQFSSWNRTTNEIVLKANPLYVDGRPHLEQVIVRTYPDTNALWLALLRGEVDFIKFINRQDYEILKDDPRFKAYAIEGGFNYAVVFNGQEGILADRELRFALSQVVDREELMRVCGIPGIASYGPLAGKRQGEGMRERTSDSIVRARHILARHGWRFKSEDNLYYKRGRPLELTLLVEKSQEHLYRIALALRQQWAEVGIKVKVVTYDQESELTPELIGRLKPQMWLRIFVNGEDEDGLDSLRSWSSKSSEFGRIWKANPSPLDRLYERCLQSEGDARRDAIKAMLAEFDRQQPACFLFFYMSYSAVSSRVQGTDSFFTAYMPAHLMKEWYISKERR